MQKSNEFFATARPLKLFFMVALPGLISMLAMSLYQIAEGAFVGHTIGESAFAAMNIAMPAVMINFSLADLIGVGSSAPISVSLGRGDNQRANNIFTCSIIMIFVAGFIMGLIFYFVAPFFVGLMGAEGTLAELSVKYVRVYAIMSPVTTVVFATDNYLRISGFVKGSMLLNIFMTVLTVVFLAIFLGVMGKGVEFSALSSCLSMFICAIIALIPFVAGKAILKFTKPKFSFKMIGEIVSCGMPIFLSNIAGRVASIFMNASLLRVGEQLFVGGGDTAVATYSVLMYASGIVEPMLYGMNDSISPAVGYNWGAGSLDRVRDITKVTLTVCGILSIFCTAVGMLFPEAIVSIFVDPEDTNLMQMSISALRVFSVAFLVGWFAFAIQNFFAAIEKPLPATIISVCKSMVFPIILIFALSPMGLNGLWLNYAGSSLLCGFLSIILLIFAQKKLRLDIQKNKSKTTEI